ncbi:MAG: asparagine synthetase B family protein [Lysobacterales bacterium]
MIEIPATAPIPSAPDVVGDFLFGFGREAADWVTRRAEPAQRCIGGGDFALLASGAVAIDETPSRLRFGLRDLVRGNPQQTDTADWRGRFVQVDVDCDDRRVRASVDHFATVPLYWLAHRDELLLATDLRLLLDAPWCRREPDPAAIYHLLNFGFIPAPLCFVAGIQRLLPASRLDFRSGELRLERYWRPSYPEDLGGDTAERAGELRQRIVDTVQRYRPDGDAGWGCFLSGGTDSSSITTILARQHADRRVRSFSIGFAESGYDELDYARLAASACGAEAHTRNVSRADTLALLPTLIELCDQPFGNASTIPTHACAVLARDAGVSILVAGDGGDEIFGGNERYAKDRVLGRYHGLPAPLKHIGNALGALAGRSRNHFLQRIANFTERGSLPNPDRFYTDEAFASDYFNELLEPRLAAHLTPGLSLDFLRDTYAQCDAGAELHRLMCLDLDMAIAQCDLVKVHRASRIAGVSVRFPYLDPDLVDYTGRLPAEAKVRGLDKRHLFKRALADVLPPAILTKKKQGFGLPIAVWLARDPEFREIAHDAVLGSRARARGWFRADCVAGLLAQHEAGSWDWSAEIWRLITLELWMRRYLDR